MTNPTTISVLAVGMLIGATFSGGFVSTAIIYFLAAALFFIAAALRSAGGPE